MHEIEKRVDKNTKHFLACYFGYSLFAIGCMVIFNTPQALILVIGNVIIICLFLNKKQNIERKGAIENEWITNRSNAKHQKSAKDKQ